MLPADFTFDIYPIIVAIGVLLALFVFDQYFKKAHIKKGISTDYEILFVVSAAIGFIFAILFQNLYDFIKDPSSYKWTWAMTFFGGFVGGVATFFIGQRLFIHKKHPYSMVPTTIIAGGGIPLAHGIGRIACTLDGCCYGAVIPEDSPFYWMGIEFRTKPGVKVYPTQLMEAIFLLILAAILITLAFKKNSLLTLPIYCISYGIFRFLIEFLRGDKRGAFIPGLTPSQFWALLLLATGIVYLILVIHSKKTHLEDYSDKLEFEENSETQQKAAK